jgi:hypothetical protein
MPANPPKYAQPECELIAQHDAGGRRHTSSLYGAAAGYSVDLMFTQFASGCRFSECDPTERSTRARPPAW